MDIIFRNLNRLVNCGSGGEKEPIEPMSEWKWRRLLKLTHQYGISPWVADGAKVYADDFFFQPSPSLRQQLLEAQGEKNQEILDKFELLLYRTSRPFNRFSQKSLRAYAEDFIHTIKNIEE